MPKFLDPRKKYEAVLEVLERRDPLSVIARRYGMSEQSLRNAKKSFLQGGKDTLTGKGPKTREKEIKSLQKQVKERDQLIGEYVVANRILKKKAGH